VHIEFIKDLILRNGKFALNLISSYARTAEGIISLGLEIRKRNLAGRTAFVLLYFSNEIYHSRIFELPVSRKEIADLISMSSANVIRTFSEFRRDGIIRANGRNIEIIDINKLEVISRRG
jgi:CRP/FNR family transcriptional regulator